MQKVDTRTKRVPWSRNERKIFAAFEWNDHVKVMYEDIFKEIKQDPQWTRDYGYKLQFQYGAESITTVDTNWKSTVTQDEIEKFILLNKQLYDVFVERISACDLFIADITSHTPNVMLELGIAVQHNKNILVVTSQDIKDMVFDIRGLHAYRYVSKEKLRELIEKHIHIYSTIKDQTLEGTFLSSKKYTPNIKGILKDKEAIPVPGIPKLKNLRIKVRFRFLYSTNHEYDWFGVSLRTQGPWRYYSELVLVRFSGKTRSLTWPEKRKENEGNTVVIDQNKWYRFELVIDEKRVAAFIDDIQVIEDVNVIIDDFGELWLASLDHHEMNQGVQNSNGNYLEVEYKDIEILDLSSTTDLFRKGYV